MLVGLPPFHHSNRIVIFNLILDNPAIFPAQLDVSESAKQLVLSVIKRPFKFKSFNLLFFSAPDKESS